MFEPPLHAVVEHLPLLNDFGDGGLNMEPKRTDNSGVM
jgi:hypothetical protein